ncbi:MAG: DegT/DnrJ/EryC1/StrS family aminotransferase [Acidobacteria bacterium]|nr:DegT/DnrJ/EryC1/StrS family aminotransferase [Acidobacteriota bacterium]
MTAPSGRVEEPIPAVDLRAQYAVIGAEIRAAIEEVLTSQQFILGPELAALEQEVAQVCGRRFGIGVGSGTDALVLALRACGIGRGDEVIVPAFSFIATAGAVSLLGARPVFVDIEPRTFNLDPARIESCITPKTRAIMPVHLYGLPAEMDTILPVAGRRGLAVIEDNAQAIGASYKGRKTGALGQLGCLSFYPSKNLGAYGDAGMIVTDSEEWAARLRLLRDHGQARKYISEEQGWNSRLDEIQAAVLRVKLRHLDAWKAARQGHAAEYNKLLGQIPGVTTPAVPEGSEHVYHQYTIRVPERDRVQRALAARGIASTVYYPVPLHLQPLYAALGYKRGDLPEAERASGEVLSLPMYAELRPEQIARVAEAVAAALRA